MQGVNDDGEEQGSEQVLEPAVHWCQSERRGNRRSGGASAVVRRGATTTIGRDRGWTMSTSSVEGELCTIRSMIGAFTVLDDEQLRGGCCAAQSGRWWYEIKKR